MEVMVGMVEDQQQARLCLEPISQEQLQTKQAFHQL
jgi:hypothetical protein